MTVTAFGPTGQTPRAEKSNRQRLDAQPSLSLVEVGGPELTFAPFDYEELCSNQRHMIR